MTVLNWCHKPHHSDPAKHISSHLISFNLISSHLHSPSTFCYLSAWPPSAWTPRWCKLHLLLWEQLPHLCLIGAHPTALGLHLCEAQKGWICGRAALCQECSATQGCCQAPGSHRGRGSSCPGGKHRGCHCSCSTWGWTAESLCGPNRPSHGLPSGSRPSVCVDEEHIPPVTIPGLPLLRIQTKSDGKIQGTRDILLVTC